MQDAMENQTNGDDRLVRRMLRAREAVMWFGMAFLLLFMAMGALWLFGGTDPAAGSPAGRPGGRLPLEEQVSDGGLLGQYMNPDRWTGGATSGSPARTWALGALVILGIALPAWLAYALFACARRFGGLAYAVGHTALVLAGTPLLLVGPAWVPLLVEDDIRQGRAARVRRLPSPTRIDVTAIALASLALAAYLALYVV